MNALQSFAVRLAARIAPPLRNLLRSADGTVERLAEEVYVLRQLNDDRRQERDRVRGDLLEALAMTNGGPGTTGPSVALAVREKSDTGAVVVLKERLAELELALEDRGWKRQLAIGETEFSRYGIQQLILISRLYFIKNPLIRRGVEVSSHYIFGRGIEISSPDETANEALQAFFSDPRNTAEIGHAALVHKEESLHTDGNLFLAFFTSVDDGQTLVRSIDATEIEEIITDPDDHAVPQYYHRRWTQQSFDPTTGTMTPKPQDAWYVALGFDPPAGLKEIKGQPLMRDSNGDFIPVLHKKVGGLPKWHFGCPLVYAALDWARAYRHFLEDWATLNRMLTRIGAILETQGGAPAIAAWKTALATTLGTDGQSIERNPTPVAGSTLITGPGNKYTPVKTQGVSGNPEQGRRVMLMVAAAFGLPETFFGDASTGSLATAVSLDRPTELKFLEAQERWRELLQRVAHYVLERSNTAPKGKLREANEARKKAGKVPVKTVVDVKFPSILEHDIGQRVLAIVQAMTLQGKGGQVVGIDEKTGVALLLAELGVEDVQAVLDEMYPEATYEPDRTLEPEPAAPPVVPAAGAPPIPPPEGGGPPRVNGKARLTKKEANLVRAVTALRGVLARQQQQFTKGV